MGEIIRLLIMLGIGLDCAYMTKHIIPPLLFLIIWVILRTLYDIVILYYNSDKGEK